MAFFKDIIVGNSDKNYDEDISNLNEEITMKIREDEIKQESEPDIANKNCLYRGTRRQKIFEN